MHPEQESVILRWLQGILNKEKPINCMGREALTIEIMLLTLGSLVLCPIQLSLLTNNHKKSMGRRKQDCFEFDSLCDWCLMSLVIFFLFSDKLFYVIALKYISILSYLKREK